MLMLSGLVELLFVLFLIASWNSELYMCVVAVLLLMDIVSLGRFFVS